MSRRPDRVLFPESGFTKYQAIDYYRSVARVLLPHLKNRPMSFLRFPDTVRGVSFWEKDAPSFTPAWVKRVPVPRRDGGSDIEYLMVNDLRTLTWVADVGCIELHAFLHRKPRIDLATEVVFDLDPGPGATIIDCCRVAVALRDALEPAGLQTFVKVSGSKGLQVHVPLNGNATHDTTEAFARLVAGELARKHPKLVVAQMAKNLRVKKVFIDWSQNADYKTTISVYSLRAKSSQPFVSMPMKWKEIEAAIDHRDPDALFFDPPSALKRIARLGDVFAPVLELKQSLGDDRKRPPAPRRKAAPAKTARLPRPESQSGRRLFTLMKTESGNELWLDMHNKFKRWILRSDREGGPGLIALPAGDFKIDPAYYRGEVPAQWRKRTKIDDIGTYELVEGSYGLRRFDLFFTGTTLNGEWLLEKISPDPKHKSWMLKPR